LLDIHRLQPFDATPDGVQRLLASAGHSLAEARLISRRADTKVFVGRLVNCRNR
jgi:hypothetical protein